MVLDIWNLGNPVVSSHLKDRPSEDSHSSIDIWNLDNVFRVDADVVAGVESIAANSPLTSSEALDASDVVFSKPWLDSEGRLRIPFNVEPKYRWWNGGQDPFYTLLELGASDRIVEQSIGLVSTPAEWWLWHEVVRPIRERTMVLGGVVAPEDVVFLRDALQLRVVDAPLDVLERYLGIV